MKKTEEKEGKMHQKQNDRRKDEMMHKRVGNSWQNSCT